MPTTDRRDFLKTLAAAGVAGGTFSGNRTVSAQEVRVDPATIVDMPAETEIWDLHCHLKRRSDTPARTQMDRMLQYADRLGIDRLVFLSLDDADAKPPAIRRMNDLYMRVLERQPKRTLGFVYLIPEYPDFCLEELDRCVANGPMVGIKLWVSTRCSDPKLDPIVERAAELNAVVFQHTWIKTTGNLPGESTPMDLVELSTRHPGVPMICGHAGGNWELGIRAIRSRPELSLGIAGFDPTAGVTEMAVRELGPERVLYGSDAGGRSFASQLAKVLGAEVSNEAKRLILGQNLRKLLKPQLEAKGLL